MNNFIQKGTTLAATLAAAVVSGQLVLLGNGKVPAVAAGTYAANTEGEYDTGGVYALPSATTGTAVVGDKAYWDSTANVATVTATNNDPIGHFAAPKAAADATAAVRLWL
jgi:predicted RecA/RadA family phage recombinase